MDILSFYTNICCQNLIRANLRVRQNSVPRSTFSFPNFVGSIYLFALHSVFSIFDSFYLPFAIVYFVGRIYSACLSNEACSCVSVRDYLTPEILIIAASCCLQIPTLTLVIQLLEHRRSFAKVRKPRYETKNY